MLARRIYGSAGSANMTVGRRHVDDAAASLGKHDAHLMLHAEQRTQDVGVESRSVGFCSLFRHRARFPLSSSAIDGGIQTTKARDGLIHQITHIVIVTHIGAQEFRLSTKL